MSERTPAEVGRLVGQRMRDLRLSTRQVVVATKVDRKTLMGMLDGSRWPQEDTRFKVEEALRWAAGSIQDLRDGGNARELAQTAEPVTDPLQRVTDEELIAEIRRRMKGARHGVADETSAAASTQAKQDEEVSGQTEDWRRAFFETPGETRESGGAT